MLLSVLLSLAALCCLSAESTSSVLPVDSPTDVQVSCTAPGSDDVDTIRSLLRNKVLPALDCPFLGTCSQNPATSCKQILEQNPSAPSGDYWVQKCDGSVVQVYCDMSSRCCNSTAGWMRVAYLNMTNPQHQCPPGLRLASPPATKRACEKKHGPSCVSYFFSTHGIPYSQVCGRVIAYQDGTPDGFGPYFYYGQQLGYTIDDNYLDGISLTHGFNPRKHVWTFIAGAGALYPQYCPCSPDIDITIIDELVPPFVGNDYFCDSARSQPSQNNVFYGDNPLWDGQNCGPGIACCQFNNPPWFCKQLPEETRDNLEMRTCANGGQNDEEVAVEQIELFVL